MALPTKMKLYLQVLEDDTIVLASDNSLALRPGESLALEDRSGRTIARLTNVIGDSR